MSRCDVVAMVSMINNKAASIQLPPLLCFFQLEFNTYKYCGHNGSKLLLQAGTPAVMSRNLDDPISQPFVPSIYRGMSPVIFIRASDVLDGHDTSDRSATPSRTSRNEVALSPSGDAPGTEHFLELSYVEWSTLTSFDSTPLHL